VIGNLQFKATNSCTLPAHLIGLKWEHKKIALFAYIFNIANSGMKPAKFQKSTWSAKKILCSTLILIIAWLLGLVSGYTMGNFIYILLVVAIVLILVRLIQGKKI
jgi:hypothetical protein